MKSSEFLDNLKSGATVIDMSSVKPETAKFHGKNLKSKKYKLFRCTCIRWNNWCRRGIFSNYGWWRTKYI